MEIIIILLIVLLILSYIIGCVSVAVYCYNHGGDTMDVFGALIISIFFTPIIGYLLRKY